MSLSKSDTIRDMGSMSRSYSFEIATKPKDSQSSSSGSGWKSVITTILAVAGLTLGIITCIDPEAITRYMPNIQKDSFEYWLVGEEIGGAAVLLGFLAARNEIMPSSNATPPQSSTATSTTPKPNARRFFRLPLMGGQLLTLEASKNNRWINRQYNIELEERGGTWYQIIDNERAFSLNLAKTSIDDLCNPQY